MITAGSNSLCCEVLQFGCKGDGIHGWIVGEGDPGLKHCKQINACASHRGCTKDAVRSWQPARGDAAASEGPHASGPPVHMPAHEELTIAR